MVVAWAPDRLARTARDRLALVEACRDAGVIIALVRGSDMDPTTPAGRLVVQGVRVARKRVWRLMRAAGLQGRHPKPWKRTTIAGQRPIDAADLIGRDFTAEQPNTPRGSAVRSDRAGQHRGAPAHRPRRAASLIRLARAALLRRTACATTSLLVRTAGALSRPSLSPDVLTALQAPCRTAWRRRALDDFVADNPLEPGHPSRAPFDAVAARLEEWRMCLRWRCGARATRCSPAGTCATCSTACHTPRCTATGPHRPWSPGTAVLVRPAWGGGAARLSRLSTATLWQRLGMVDSVWSCVARSVRLYRGTDTPRTSR